MRVKLYKGNFALVRKSGVGKAIEHQTGMLAKAGIATTNKWNQDYETIHINTILPDSPIQAILSKIRRKKVVYYGHSTMEDFKNSFKGSNIFAPLFKRWIISCYNLGDIIITPTPYSKHLLEGYGIKKPIYNLSNGIDADFFSPSIIRRNEFRKKYNLKADQKAVISVGHFIERKGILDFIELAKKMPDVKFFWFGHTNLKIVPKHISEAIQSAPSNLLFPGYVERDELKAAYCGCDLFAFLSNEETEGIVVLEALACGIPTIVRDIPVYSEWLSDGLNVYKAKNLSEFKNRVHEMLSGTLPDLTEAGLQTAKERSLESIANRLVAIYNNENFFAKPSAKKLSYYSKSNYSW